MLPPARHAFFLVVLFFCSEDKLFGSVVEEHAVNAKQAEIVISKNVVLIFFIFPFPLVKVRKASYLDTNVIVVN